MIECCLFLGKSDSPVLSYLESTEPKVIYTEEKINIDFLKNNLVDFIVSYGYRHIIDKETIKSLPYKIVNLHISLLPWNRGADPNFWSFVDDTPKGVSIHYIDKGIDTGDVIVQKEFFFHDNETLRSSYEKLNEEVICLFKKYWKNIRTGMCQRIKQKEGGSYHTSKDKEKLLYLLTNGFDTKVSTLNKY